MSQNIHISFSPENVINIFGLELTNSSLTGIVFGALTLIFLLVFSYRVSVFKPSTFQIIVESIYQVLFDMAENILGKSGIKKYSAFIFTFFILILSSNLAGLLPIVPAIVIKEKDEKKEIIAESNLIVSDVTKHSEDKNLNCLLTAKCILTTDGIKENSHYIPLLRATTADLSLVIVLALISVIVSNIAGFATFGASFGKKYLNFSSPIDFIVGFFEIVSEIGKIISFAFRLFGNIFAGEVLLAVITSITFGIATLPFLGFEIFVAFIQAFVFFILTTVFISLARESHH